MKTILTIFISFLLLGENLYANRGAVRENPIDVLEKSPENKALTAQRKVQVNMNLPLNRALFFGTHDSYNSSAYRRNPSNQTYTITDQLRLGARYLELEVHWTTGKSGNKELLLCRGSNLNNHNGCYRYDLTFEAGLNEISQWIQKPENQNEVLILYIKDRFEGHVSEFMRTLSSKLGTLLYRHQSRDCLNQSPMVMPKLEDMVKSTNHRIFLTSNNCYSPELSDTWGYYFRKDPFVSFQPSGFRGYPDCNFSRETYHNSLVRVYNDTIAKNANDRGGSFTNSNIQSMLACEVNLFGFDQFNANFAKQAVWSWDSATNQPLNREDQEHCARISVNGRWSTHHCDMNLKFACKDRNTGNWIITSNRQGPWRDGSSACLLYPQSPSDIGRYQFAAPATPYENKKLQDALISSGNSQTVWINLTKKDGDNWAPDTTLEGYFSNP
ncbi:phosphatidylinositol-specific phospholipase C domain-containing protein [Leptospira interrogans]|uniref:phosphatidylinositol-specific phospholipase C domain-containing protein n=1 Tax=Leptospira interrogans TaxID=173 RepID=UPI000772E418|nr:phosphatidylinositol-specific phospholipase C domain-containing protein [Leptospira interrogans]